MLFHACHGGNTLRKSEGSTIPDAMLETTDGFIADCPRLSETYRDGSPFKLHQVAAAPCRPVNCYRDTLGRTRPTPIDGN